MQSIFPATAARLEEWKAQPGVLGVVLVGSKSRGHNDELSDDDLEVLLTDEAFAQLAPSILAPLPLLRPALTLGGIFMFLPFDSLQ